MIIPSNFEQFINIVWYTHNDGTQYSKKITNEKQVCVGGRVLLNCIPDMNRHLSIEGLTEVPLGTNITDNTHFSVDYNSNIVNMPMVFNGTQVTISQYYGRGYIRFYAGNIAIQDVENLFGADNVEDALAELQIRINNIVLSGGTSPVEVIDARFDSINNITYPVLKNRLDKDAENIKKLLTDLGDKSTLTTDEKTDLVKAINELVTNSTADNLLTKLLTVDTDTSGLNANTLQGKQASEFATSTQGTKADNALPSTSYTPSDILAKLLTVDVDNSGLNASTLQGKTPTDFATSAQGIKADNALSNTDISAYSLSVNAPFSGTVRYTKLLGLVNITCSAISSNVGNNIILCNLPTGYRPSSDVLVPIFVVTGSGLWGYNKCGLKIGTDGNVTFVTETTDSTKAIYCSFTYHI